MDWLSEHSDALSALASFGLLAVWLAYLQLFLSGFRRQRRASLVISRGAGTGLSTQLVVSNMSAEAVHLSAVLARIGENGPGQASRLRDMERLDGGQTANPSRLLRSGERVDAGPFSAILPNEAGAGETLEITVIAFYGPDDELAGARRRFRITPDPDGMRLIPCSAETAQIRARRERKALRTLLEREMGDQPPG